MGRIKRGVKPRSNTVKFKAKKSSDTKLLKPLKSKSSQSLKTKSSKPGIDMAALKAQIQKQLKRSDNLFSEPKADKAAKSSSAKSPQAKSSRIMTGIPGFDELFEKGIPRGNAVLLAGGAGSGKTLFSLQVLHYHASRGHKCYYMSFEESEQRLMSHMKDLGFDPEKMIKAGNLRMKRYSPFEITRSVEAMLAKEKGELLIDLEPVILPKGFNPDIVVVDSLTAVASAFTGKEDSYRIYIEQLFRFFERLDTTSFLITETKQIPDIFSTTGVEEFLADGVIVLYNIKRGNIRENAIEVLKMRGEKHQKKIVAMQITERGLIVYPDQEVFSDIGRNE